jgi:ABC-type dipeptide/oligopeptide/nickel transport system permease subunit
MEQPGRQENEKTSSEGKKLLLLRRLLRNKFNLFGLGITLGAVLVAVLARFLAPHSPVEIFPLPMSPPSAEFLLGTDYLGRCLLSRIIYGAQVSLGVAVSSVAISLTLGIFLGLVAGYYEGALGGAILRGMDILLSFPLVILALGIIAMLGPSVTNLILTIGVVYTPTFVRLVNGSVLSVKRNEYVTAARALGSRDARVLSLHILPNIVAPIIVQASLTFSTAILVERPQFSGDGDPAADSVLGGHDLRKPDDDGTGPLDGHLPGPGPFLDRDRAQPPGGRPAGRLRSVPEGIMKGGLGTLRAGEGGIFLPFSPANIILDPRARIL